MEDSFKGVWVAAAVISIFIVAILNFIVLFPQEQGFEFNYGENDTYLSVANITYDYEDQLDLSEENTDSAFQDWDIEVGFMGSNSQKNTGKESVTGYTNSILNNTKSLAKILFSTDDGSTHPVIWVLSILSFLAGLYLIYVTIKFIRTGS